LKKVLVLILTSVVNGEGIRVRWLRARVKEKGRSWSDGDKGSSSSYQEIRVWYFFEIQFRISTVLFAMQCVSDLIKIGHRSPVTGCPRRKCKKHENSSQTHSEVPKIRPECHKYD
jgi:hypothetical protein